ncbi:cysteine--1-D-myo-inosityl 2-amino-2-deoxy-alpha-D-glucopyranoside ligase [Blastococcus sp. Marseille-P5729]|uniref:cysteine--1-D-myo-inosityl 2-amino-2-deoxy-alpha-D-glucopyranoside ligase n=1 Tax=Blastococcus sp. Marseille-P5729 TaxID=2086582 RepID=UPI000D0F0F48|nr:cysteine--1-D-myo-inosityl 2-amino-2-deoxy-alpha-D-glucopyranoside ligase [Blastococcus sp. Marseille-P5729]
MRSWPEVTIPVVPGSGPGLRLHDSASDQVRPITAQGTATLYVCGITPYDATHLGHAATYLTFDMVQRVLRDQGLDVRYVQNVTDVDDPLIERAQRDGIRWQDLAERETDLFRFDMEALRISPPDEYLGAVETMDLVVTAVERLLDSGQAYRLEDGTGDVYFDVATDDRFGYVSRYDAQTMLELSAERGGDPDRAGKRNRLDPLLWKGKRDGDPSWPSSLGAGRPGWHIECAAIALEHLGEQIDIQGGGEDLRFPHHECSAAHAEAITGLVPFAGHYTHAGMIGYDGEKMSKSLGNLVKVSGLTRDGVEPMVIRLALLRGHYRDYREWTDDYLDASERTLSLWREAVRRPIAPAAEATIATMRACLANDLDTDGAVEAVTRWANQRPAHNDSGLAVQAMEDAVDALLGIKL